MDLTDTCPIASSELLQSELCVIAREYFNNPQVYSVNDESDESFSEDEVVTESTIEEEVDGEQQEKAIDWTEEDQTERNAVHDFVQRGCGCHMGPSGSSCSSQFTVEQILTSRGDCLELTRAELDLVILGMFRACLSNTRAGKRKRWSCVEYCYRGIQVCKSMFMFLHAVAHTRLENLRKHFQSVGLVTREHGNKRKLPHNCSSTQTVNDVKTFIHNYSEEFGLILPGRVPGFKRADVRLLPSSQSKASVWRQYKIASEKGGKQPVCYSKFVQLWNRLTPYIVFMKPMTDLCFTCQLNNNKILRSANRPEQEKTALVRAQEQHLFHSQRERDFYRNSCKEAARALSELLLNGEFHINEKHAPCSYKGTVHYSYDYAQQVHYPSNPLQPGPIYFKTPRKCALFGVCSEGLPRQVNFLIDEAVSCGKGANATISYMHYFFLNYGVGETDVHLNADNCAGQNKNNYFLWYYAWRTIKKLHSTILSSYLLPGHTKFAPDWCFGLSKQAISKDFVSSLFELANTINRSTVSGVNISQLAGLHNGNVIVPVYDWISFFSPYFRKLSGIKNYQHFRFDSATPGVCYCREFVDSPEVPFQLLKDASILPPTDTLPQIVTPMGLDQDRKEYLYKEIRQFCKPGTEDLVAPKP